MATKTETRFEDLVQHLTEELGEVVTAYKPNNPDGWETFGVLVQAHKTLRKLSLEKLIQLPLSFNKEGEQ